MHQTTTTCWPSRSNLTATTHKSNNIPLLLELELGVASKIVYLDNFYIKNNFGNVDHCCCSVAQSCLTLCDPMDCSTPGFPVLHYLLEFAQTHVHPVGDAICHVILCCPLLLLPSVFPSTRVFSSELALHIRPKYWSFRSSTSREYSGLISFRIDWFELLAVQGTIKGLLTIYEGLIGLCSDLGFMIISIFKKTPYSKTKYMH